MAKNQKSENTKTSRGSICTKSYVQPEGKNLRSATPETTAISFAFADGEEILVDVSNIPENVQKAAMWHGLSQKLGDSYATLKTPEEAREGNDSKAGFLTTLEMLQGGEWIQERQGSGPRPSMLVDAVVAALLNDGQEVDDSRRASITETLKDANNRKSTMANPLIRAEYEKIKAERATDRAQKAVEKAKSSDASLDAF